MQIDPYAWGRLRNLVADSVYAIGDRFLYYLRKIGEALAPLLVRVVPKESTIVILDKRLDAVVIAEALKSKTGWDIIDICTKRENNETIIENLDEVVAKLKNKRPDAILFLDYVCCAGTTVEKVAGEIRKLLPSVWLGFVSILGSEDGFRKAEELVDWGLTVLQSQVDYSVTPSRLKSWVILSDIGDRIRNTLQETPIEWERNLVRTRLDAYLSNNFAACNSLEEIRAIDFTSKMVFIGAPICYSELARIRYDYRNPGITLDTWLSIIRLGQDRGVPYPMDGNWHIKSDSYGGSHLRHNGAMSSIEELRRYGFVERKAPFLYRPHPKFIEAFVEIVNPVLTKFKWSLKISEYAYDSLTKNEKLINMALRSIST